ncbi:helix-turn-helix domain-containing protein [Erysipelotrichaceae bacterium RD49]|nr:helix-turn-helix domain-containing protein [Erysipelotrichaceae bacterium RD49]
MFKLAHLSQMPVYRNEITDTESITTNEFAKKLRKSLGLSQRMFSKALGISEKTVEKWEQGANPIKGAASRLLYLIDQDHSLIDKLYRFKVSEQKESSEYLIKREDKTDVDKDIEDIKDTYFNFLCTYNTSDDDDDWTNVNPPTFPSNYTMPNSSYFA